MSKIHSILVRLQSQLREAADACRKKTASQTSSATPVQPACDPAFRHVLDEVASVLLFQSVICTQNASEKRVYALREVELYAQAPHAYEDRFTHADPQQALLGAWYFHKKGGTFKGGSFKGLDITFGSGSDVVVGALIRSIQLVAVNGSAAPNASLCEGPSLVVDELLSATGAASIAALVGSKDGVLFVHEQCGTADPHLLLLHVSDIASPPMLSLDPGDTSKDQGRLNGMGVAPRVGLVPRSRSDLVFAGKLLRYFHPQTKLAKQRAGVVAALLANGTSQAEAQRLSGATAKNVAAIKAVLDAVATGKTTMDKIESVDGGTLAADVMQSDVIATIVAWASKSSCL